MKRKFLIRNVWQRIIKNGKFNKYNTRIGFISLVEMHTQQPKIHVCKRNDNGTRFKDNVTYKTNEQNHACVYMCVSVCTFSNILTYSVELLPTEFIFIA